MRRTRAARAPSLLGTTNIRKRHTAQPSPPAHAVAAPRRAILSIIRTSPSKPVSPTHPLYTSPMFASQVAREGGAGLRYGRMWSTWLVPQLKGRDRQGWGRWVIPLRHVVLETPLTTHLTTVVGHTVPVSILMSRVAPPVAPPLTQPFVRSRVLPLLPPCSRTLLRYTVCTHFTPPPPPPEVCGCIQRVQQSDSIKTFFMSKIYGCIAYHVRLLYHPASALRVVSSPACCCVLRPALHALRPALHLFSPR